MCVFVTPCCRLLKDKRQMDDSFNSFLELKRGAAMHTLESLMLLPVRAHTHTHTHCTTHYHHHQLLGEFVYSKQMM